VKGGVYMRHGEKVNLCSSDGCSNIFVKGGVCILSMGQKEKAEQKFK
jgi:hypothetical protein